MRIAILSDIHGNLMALDAVMSDVEKQSPDEIWCGGDLGWGGPWAAECIDRVRDAGWPTVRGNTDVWLTGDPQTVQDPERRAWMQQMAAAHDVGAERAAWLMQLPLGHSGSGSLLLVHGTPHSPFEAPLPEAPAADYAEYESHAKIVVFAHVHVAFVRRLGDGTIVCNTGSVGLPKDGPTACYVLIDQHGPEWTIKHRRVAYDRRAALAQAERVGAPAGSFFAEQLDAFE